MTRPRTPVDAGYTVLEMVVTIALAGTLMAIAVGGYQGWARASAQQGLADRLQSSLRLAQQRAVTEGSSMCVLFAGDTWRLYRGACTSSSKTAVAGAEDAGDGLHLGDPRFTVGVGSTTTGVTFTPRGSATPGRVRVTRDDSDHVLTVTVDSLTGRVSAD